MIFIRLGFLVAASIAAYTVRQISFNSRSSLIKPSDTGEIDLKHFNDEEREKNKFKDSKDTAEKEEEEEVLIITDIMNSDDLSGPINFEIPNNMHQMNSDSGPKKDNLKSEIDIENDESELECLRSLVNELEERQEKLKRKLSVYYGMEQQEMEIFEMKKRLKMKTDEIYKLSMTIKPLNVENKKLQEEITQCVLEKNQLKKASIKINELEKKFQTTANPRKGQVIILKERVESIRADEDPKSDAEIQKKLKAGNRLELEAMELRRRHKELQLEKRVLAIKLNIAEARATAFSNTTESGVIKSIRVDTNALTLANEDLLKQVERLQKERFNGVEELVYHRWVNSCLRHEIQNHQAPSRRSSTSDSERVSSRRSSTERKEFYHTPKDIPSSGKSRIGQKTGLIHKLKRWRRSLDSSSVGSSLNRSFGNFSRGTTSSDSTMSRRSSISFGSLEASKLKNVRDRLAVIAADEKSATGSPETVSVLRRRRRVSFNDSLNTAETSSERMSLSDDRYVAYNDRLKIVPEVEKPIKEKPQKVRTEIFSDSSNFTSSFKTSGGDPLTSPYMPNSSEKNIDASEGTTQAISEIEHYDHSEESAPRVPRAPDINIEDVQSKELHLDAIFVFFLLVVLLCALLRSVSVF